jgi:hypothetical protein
VVVIIFGVVHRPYLGDLPDSFFPFKRNPSPEFDRERAEGNFQKPGKMGSEKERENV